MNCVELARRRPDRVFAASRQTIYAAFAVAEIVIESGNARNGVV